MSAIKNREGKMIKFECDLCKKELVKKRTGNATPRTNTLAVFTGETEKLPNNESRERQLTWDICDECIPLLKQNLGEPR
jgi:hypothetical protein